MNSLTVMIVVAILCLTTLGVVETITDYKAEQEKRNRELLCADSWTPPPIPKCDKATWDRIVEGCDE